MSVDASVPEQIRRLLCAIGEDTKREGLQNTPSRVHRFYEEWLDCPPPSLTTFDAEGMSEMIVQRDVRFYSLCEHHMLPFFGTGLIAYIPDGQIVGLSKLARVLQWRSQRLQNQERITQQVADVIEKTIRPKGVAVILKARHMCMEMRGIRTPEAETITSCLRGVFMDGVPRAEVLSLAGLK